MRFIHVHDISVRSEAQPLPPQAEKHEDTQVTRRMPMEKHDAAVRAPCSRGDLFRRGDWSKEEKCVKVVSGFVFRT